MFRLLLFCAMFAIPGFAQDSRTISSVGGTIVSDEPLEGNSLVVVLIEEASHTRVGRAFVASDGRFEFHSVAPGFYTIQLANSTGQPIHSEEVNLNAPNDRIEIRLPAHEKQFGAGTVSVRILQLSSKSKKLFARAEHASKNGEHLKAVEFLRASLVDPSAVALAHLNMGVEYMKAHDLYSAIPEFRESVRLMPEDSIAHTNYCYGLLAAKQIDAAEQECRRALAIDRNSPKAHWILGSILLLRGSHEEEAIANLRSAGRDLPQVKMLIAKYYERNGRKDEAARELREFLPQASAGERAKVEIWLNQLK